ncbi:MAG: endonuclease MutS2 [Desulfuromonadales bacterium]|nr:endonuclease MutS2 [Desulfuromonadales bacterium]
MMQAFDIPENAVADSLVQLEFAKVVELTIGRTQTAYGRALAAALTPSFDRAQIVSDLEQAAAAGAVLREDGPLPLGSGANLLPELDQLRTEGVRLEAEVLREVQAVVEATIVCRKQLLASEVSACLRPLGENLVPLPKVASEIARSIGPRGEILDSASAELADLRHSMKSERNRVRRTMERMLQDESLQGVFQESLVTDRNGRYVLPVRTDHSGRIKGFVHDVSASGQTLYMEPAAALESNNRVQTLLRQIAREEERILARLSAAVRDVRTELASNQQILAQLDLRQAIARLARELDATIPQLTDQPLLELRNARHPLLVLGKRNAAESDEVIPVDLLLPQACSALIVSGPNTGGKTLALKTAGLLALMVRAGMPIPCAEGSKLFPFAPVMADIGDEQSIEQSLSTFSGHLLRLRRILQRADATTLVLMDELGTGTDPGEGAALALAAVDKLRSKGTRVMATTHLHTVKGYAQLEDQVENAAVEFDTETLQPSYRLHYGIPGASHAFTIARRIGLPEEVLSAATNYLGQNEREGGEIIERLQSLRATLEQQLDQAQQLRSEADQDRQRTQQQKQALESRQREMVEQTRQQGVKLLAEAEKKLQKLFRQVPVEPVQPKQRAELKGELRSLKESLPKPLAQGPQQTPETVDASELLYVPALGVEAEVVRCVGAQIELLIGGKKLRQPKSALRQFQPRRFVTKQKQQPRLRDQVERKAFQPRLLLVGQRVEEAESLLEKFFDEALLHGAAQLEVVHGAGQGILRKSVRAFLAQRREVSSFQAAGPEQGGDNVTVVELRH